MRNLIPDRKTEEDNGERIGEEEDEKQSSIGVFEYLRSLG